MVKRSAWCGVAPLFVLCGATGLQAADRAQVRVVRYAPAPGWVTAAPKASEAPTPPGAPLRIISADQQVRITDRGQEEYQATRLALLTPEALSAGNLAMTWSPANEEPIVHRLTILRDGQTIDVLATQKFTVIQRENNLEQSALDGNLTATLQIAGLQVGDVMDFAVTMIRHQTRLGERPQGFLQFPAAGGRGTYRVRVIAPTGSGIAFRTTPDLPQPVVREMGPETERELTLVDPASVTIPEGAPPRYAFARLIQFGGYADWAAVSRTFSAPYARAGTLGTASAVKAEAAKIAAATSDPAQRVMAALQLVQDRIRYVYVGLDGGNYQPAPVDDTWRRRFGDCKAKTVLLIALLNELGIAAEPVLVASKGGDGIDERLPTPAMFDHVVVRATIGTASIWLDGTRLGDRSLAGLVPPPSRWGLPLRAGGAALERIMQTPARVPNTIHAVDIDASAGFDTPGKYRIQVTMRGDEIFGMRAQLAGLAPADADKALVAYWRQLYPVVEASHTSWRFDEANRLLVLGLEGEGKVDWDGDATEGHTHYLFGAGFPPPDEMKRPKDQPQDVPWATDYPSFSCYATTVKVPAAGKRFRWSFSSRPMDRQLAGASYWRIASFDGTTARMVKSRRVDVPEIGAKEAAAVPTADPKFDNNKSYIWEVPGKTRRDASETGVDASGKFGTFADFAGANPPCQKP